MPTGHYYCLPAARLFKLFEFGMEPFCDIEGLTSSRNRRPKFSMFLLNDLTTVKCVYVCVCVFVYVFVRARVM